MPQNDLKQQLMQLRSSGQMSDEALVNMFKGQDDDFASKYNETVRKELRFRNQAGEEIPVQTASLNYYLYGNPFGEKGDVSMDPLKGQGYFANIAERFQRSFGNEDVRAGRAEVKGLGQGFGAAIKDIPGDIADVAGKALPFAGFIGGGAAGAAAGGGVASAALGSFGAAGGSVVGEAVRQKIGDVMNVNQKYGADEEARLPNQASAQQEIKSEAVSGLFGELGGRAFIGAGKLGMRNAKKILTKVGAILTNVDDGVLRRAFDNPSVISKTMKEVSSSPKQPFLPLAKQISNKMISMRNAAKQEFTNAVEAFKKQYPKVKFNLAVPENDITTFLKKYNLGLQKGQDGALELATLGKVNPLDDKEFSLLNEAVNKVMNANGFSPDDVVNFRHEWGKLYNAIEYGNTNEPKFYHKLISELRSIADENFKKHLPDQLKNAYKAFADTAKMKAQYGKYFLKRSPDSKGEVLSDTAEGFLMRINNLNKGQQRTQIGELSDMLGINIAKQAETISDAGKLLQIFPATGGRTLDIIRSLLINKIGGVAGAAGVGIGVAGGVPGAITAGLGGLAGAAATSPLVYGKMLRASGRVINSPITKAIGTFIDKMAPAEKAALYEILNSIPLGGAVPTKKIPGANGLKSTSNPRKRVSY